MSWKNSTLGDVDMSKMQRIGVSSEIVTECYNHTVTEDLDQAVYDRRKAVVARLEEATCTAAVLFEYYEYISTTKIHISPDPNLSQLIMKRLVWHCMGDPIATPKPSTT